MKDIFDNEREKAALAGKTNSQCSSKFGYKYQHRPALILQAQKTHQTAPQMRSFEDSIREDGTVSASTKAATTKNFELR